MLQAEITYQNGNVYGYREVANNRECLKEAREQLTGFEVGMKFVIYKDSNNPCDVKDPIIVEKLKDGFSYDRPLIGAYNQPLKKALTWLPK